MTQYGTGFEERERAPLAPPEQPPRRFGRWIPLLAVLVLAALAAGGWFVYDRLIAEGGEQGPPPLITAEEGPVKVLPEEPGGMEVPNQDKLVYDTFVGDEEPEELEQLLPPPEEPLDATAGGPEPAAESEVAAVPEPEGPPEAEPEVAVASVAESAPVESLAVEPSPQITEAVAGGGGYLVQVGSFRTPEGAEKIWAELQKAHPDLLGALGLIVERADLGPEKGVFFRAKAGPLGKADADSLCAKLKGRSVDCLVVKI